MPCMHNFSKVSVHMGRTNNKKSSIFYTLSGLISSSDETMLNIALIDQMLASKKATFAWNSISPQCPAIHYNISAKHCGNCPTTTNHTNITCTDVPMLEPESKILCTLTVQIIVCTNIIFGNTTQDFQLKTTAHNNQG